MQYNGCLRSRKEKEALVSHHLSGWRSNLQTKCGPNHQRQRLQSSTHNQPKDSQLSATAAGNNQCTLSSIGEHQPNAQDAEAIELIAHGDTSAQDALTTSARAARRHLTDVSLLLHGLTNQDLATTLAIHYVQQQPRQMLQHPVDNLHHLLTYKTSEESMHLPS